MAPEKINGQLIFRDTNQIGANNRKRMIVIGIIDIPESFGIKNDFQYFISGRDDNLLNIIKLAVFKDDAINTEEGESFGLNADQTLRSRIWRY